MKLCPGGMKWMFQYRFSRCMYHCLSVKFWNDDFAIYTINNMLPVRYWKIGC